MRSMKIKELFPKIDIKSMKLPMIRMFVLCALYNSVYLMIQIFLFTRQGYFTGAVNAISILSSLGLYYFCVSTWERKLELNSTKVIYILGLQSFYVGLIHLILLPLYRMLSVSSAGYLCIQLICAFLLFIMIPLQLFMYRALSEGKLQIKEMKEFIMPLVKDNYQEILNQYLAILLLVILIDVLLGGQISASGVSATMINVEKGRIDALGVCMNLLYVANPWMMLAVGVVAIFVYKAAILQSLFVLLIYVVIGIVLSILEISYIQFIGDLRIKKKKKHGTKKAKTNR